MTIDATKVSGVEFYKTNNMKIEFEEYPKYSWCIDGEKLNRANLKYEIKNINKVKIMLPTKNINKIFVNKKID